jgi:hypothetical protein
MLFDPSGDQPEQSEQDDGLAAVDLLELPAALYRIMRLMLRHVEMDFAQLWDMVEKLPEAERLTRAEVEEALHSLIEQRWLIKTDTANLTTYRVNFRRKIGNVRNAFTPRTKKDRSLPQRIWDALDGPPTQTPPPDSEDEAEA